MESAGRRQGDRAGNAENTGARLVPLCAPVLFTSQDVIHDIRLYLPTHPTSPLPHDRFGVVTPVNNRHHPAGVVTSVITLPSLVRGARLDGAVEAQTVPTTSMASASAREPHLAVYSDCLDLNRA